MEEFDVVVIGAGPGGYPAAIRSAQLGQTCAVIERDAVGGTCLNVGCIPAKILMASAERYLQISSAPDLGINVPEPDIDYRKIRDRMRSVVDRLRKGINFQLQTNGVKVISGNASFLSADQIEVVTPSGKTLVLQAKKIILATGSVPSFPQSLPASDRLLDTDSFWAQEKLPDTLLILGGGVVGCEFACWTATLGVGVTIIEQLPDLLPQFDDDVRNAVISGMEDLGIGFRTDTTIPSVDVDPNGVVAHCGAEDLAAEQLLIATGRRANTEGLNLPAANVRTNSEGEIPADAFGRTNVPTIFAVGDVIENSARLAHAATHQGIVAAECDAEAKCEATASICPFCIFTIPSAACVGVTEHEAKVGSIPIRVAKLPFTACGRACATGETEGFVKWIAASNTGKLLGAQMVGPHADEMIAEATLAIQQGLTAKDIARTIHAHPTFSEAWMDAAWKIVE